MGFFHFRSQWKNGDRFVISSYGKNKKDAYINILKARKERKFAYRSGDNFHVSFYTNEEHERSLRKKGLSKSFSAVSSVYGHTAYIVDKEGKVHIN